MAQKKIEACLVCGEPLVYYETAREQVLVWAPDVIFLDPGTLALVGEELAT